MQTRVLSLQAALTLAFATTVSATPQQEYDAYGRSLPSVEELCRQGQMAGGPVTETCSYEHLVFDRQGQRIVTYDFSRWGYQVTDAYVTEADAERLDEDSKFRAIYIKSHGYDKYKDIATDASKKTLVQECKKRAEIAEYFGKSLNEGVTEDEAMQSVNQFEGGEETRQWMRDELLYSIKNPDDTPAMLASYFYNACTKQRPKPSAMKIDNQHTQASAAQNPKYSDSSFDWDHDAPMSDNEYDVGSVITKCKVNRGQAKAKLAIIYTKIQQKQAEGKDPTNGNGGNSIWAMGFTCK
jgi:hypothetical protein